MTIKHLVISGGSVLGFRYMSSLKHLNQLGFWKLEDIVTMYGTSIGTIIAVCLALNYDWDTLETYIIERPWKEVFKISGKQIFDSYTTKGIYDAKIIEQSLKPLLLAKDIDINITLLDFYELTKKELHFMTLNLNKFETIDVSYKTHPQLKLINAVYMSSSIPGAFSPICEEINGEKMCYIDGCALVNYPINPCIDSGNNPDEILGIKIDIESGNHLSKNIIVSSETNILEFLFATCNNLLHYAQNINAVTPTIKHTILCRINGEEFTLDYIKTVINDKEFRRKLWEQGITDCADYLLEHKIT